MITQRHWIQRQLFDVTVADQVTGKRLHDELSRLQETRIEALIDRCCSEFSAPDRVHRIGRIEVELGELSVENLEHELLEKLDHALRKTLEAKIREDEQLSAMIGEDPVAMAQVELISLFARTAALPFWADESRPGVVDEAVQKLLTTDARALVVLVQQLLQDTRALERLVRHVQPERLRALFEVVANASQFDGATRAAELWTLLAMSSTLSNSIPKTTLWIAALETVIGGDVRGEGPIGFFREVLGRVALALGKPYRSIVEAFYRAMGTRGDNATSVLGGVLRELAEEVGAKKVPATFGDDGDHSAERAASSFDDAPDVSILDARGTPNSPAPRVQTTGPRRTAPRIRAAQGSRNALVTSTAAAHPAFDMTQGSTLPARSPFDMTQGSTLPAR
ncbi:MAG TPA: contractile injection system tape measure protein, partial [Polyangium sp.]|nr:contractile injection system tape measure protein [Polyangium sp.]